MFDLTQSPEFMAAVDQALVQAVRKVDLDAWVHCYAEHEWLTTQEACDFLRMSLSAWKRFKVANPQKVKVSYALGNTEPRYQLAALQRLMHEKAIGGTEPQNSAVAGKAPTAKPKANGRLRALAGQTLF